MGNNSSLSAAKSAKNDEFYTQYEDIEREVMSYFRYCNDVFKDKVVLLPCDDPEWSNFTKFFVENFRVLGLKKLISTSYAIESKNLDTELFPSDFEKNSPNYDSGKAKTNGKIFILEADSLGEGHVDISSLKWDYLNGDGDFRSLEVTALRDEADFIITNEPFSLFREFLAWIIDGHKKFAIIGNQNAITYKEVFPLIQNNQIWLGATGFNNDMVFRVPAGTEVKPADKAKAAKMGYRGDYTRIGNSCWFTNIEHGRRHEPIMLMSMTDNIRYNKKIQKVGYQRYDNYDAIEVPEVKAIPSDYDGMMGVPVTFLDKYCPEQFTLIDARDITSKDKLKEKNTALIKDADSSINGHPTYARIVIKRI